MSRADHPPLRYLSAADVTAAMPPLDVRLSLAERTMVALATPGASELPPKIAIHPRPPGSFVHAMPAHLRAGDAAGDLVGMKWVAGFPDNAAHGLPAIHAVVVVNDPSTGVPVAILDGGPITAERTAAVSGVAIGRFAPAIADRAPRIAVLGAGVQARSHLPVLAALLPGASVALYDRHPDRAAALAVVGRSLPGIGGVEVALSAREAVAGADVVVSVASFTTPDARQSMTNGWLTPHALVVPVDYATYCAAEVARDAGLFVVDERGQFLANRDAGQFDGYPDPAATLGDVLRDGTARPAGRVVVTHLGVGLADLVFAEAILGTATERGIGTVLPR